MHPFHPHFHKKGQFTHIGVEGLIPVALRKSHLLGGEVNGGILFPIRESGNYGVEVCVVGTLGKVRETQGAGSQLLLWRA